MRWQPWDVIGGAYSDDTRPWSVQDTVNYLVVMAEKGGTRSPKMLRGVPGMVTFSASMPESPVRGLYVAEGRLFAVVAQSLYAIGTDGSASVLGTIPGVGRCVMTHNQVTGGNQLVIGNGQSGYVYDTVAGTLVQITDDGFPGFRSVDFIDQYIIGVEPFGRYWFHSDLADAKSYSTLDRAEAEKAPDRIQQVIATGSDVLVLGERTCQFFANTGEATGTFQNRPGTEMDIGAASPWAACRLDNTVYWLGNDGCVYRLAGYQAQRISTHAMEQAISRATIADAYAFTFEDQGHKCYLLTLPDGQTWCFDAASGEWTRRESYGLNRWRVSALVRWGRNWIAGDYVNGKLYQLDWRVQQEAGEPLERRRVTGVLHDDQNRLIVNGIEFLFDTGMDSESHPLPQPILPALTITGDVPDGFTGDVVSGAYTVTGGVAPRTVTVLSGTFPSGLTLNADGTYLGTYSTGGSYSWVVQVEDGEGSTATVSDSAFIIDAGTAVQVNTVSKMLSGTSGGGGPGFVYENTSNAWTEAPTARVGQWCRIHNAIDSGGTSTPPETRLIIYNAPSLGGSVWLDMGWHGKAANESAMNAALTTNGLGAYTGTITAETPVSIPSNWWYFYWSDAFAYETAFASYSSRTVIYSETGRIDSQHYLQYADPAVLPVDATPISGFPGYYVTPAGTVYATNWDTQKRPGF